MYPVRALLPVSMTHVATVRRAFAKWDYRVSSRRLSPR